jgi:hypothetical protein
MRRLFAALDVDFDQWKALTAVLLKLDFRGTKLGPQLSQTARIAVTIGYQLLVYSFFGLTMAGLVWLAADLLLAGTVAMAMTMFIVGMVVLLDHNSAIASPDDYRILGFRPISSRTYLAVRLANVLVYTTVLTTTVVWLPVTVLFVKHGAAVGAAGVLAFYACSTFTTLAILTGDAWLLRVIGPSAIRRALSYAQLVMSFLVYGGYALIPRLLSRNGVASLTLPRTIWWLLFPATWFASYLEIAAGRTGLMELLAAAASLLGLGALASGLGGRLSLDYSQHLGAMMTASSRKHADQTSSSGFSVDRGIRLLFRGGEARAVALLVRSQFRNDQRFRLGVLGILPVTLLYVFMGISNGALGDPFLPSRRGPGISLVTMAVMMFPPMLKMQLGASESFRASWIFFSCPIDRMNIVRASKDVLVVFFLVPYLLFLAALFTYISGNLAHVAVHIALLGLVSHLVLQVALFMDPELPFSRPPTQKGRKASSMFGLMMAASFLSVGLQTFSASLYASLPATLTVFTVVLVASAGVDRLTRARVERQTASLEFAG